MIESIADLIDYERTGVASLCNHLLFGADGGEVLLVSNCNLNLSPLSPVHDMANRGGLVSRTAMNERLSGLVTCGTFTIALSLDPEWKPSPNSGAKGRSLYVYKEPNGTLTLLHVVSGTQ